MEVNMFWKKLFYASASVLMLAFAYHLGAINANAAKQSSNAVVAGTSSFVFTANGDVYFSASPTGTR